MQCLRCKENFGSSYKCQECGVFKDRVVRYHRARRKNKRGRNSGKVSSGNRKSNR